MKTIGLIGGMSWESTALYYRYLNEAVRSRCGGLHSAQLLLASVDFHGIEEMQRQGRWDAAGRTLADLAVRLQTAGAEFLVLCTNTMHEVAPAIEAAVDIPLLHIADATAGAVRARDIRTVGLLATRFTMERPFYVGRLRERHTLDVLVPEPDERAEIHRVIYDELCQGLILPKSRTYFREVIDRLVARGARGIVLGCTEIGMLIDPASLLIAAFDTTRLHADAAVQFALAGG
jgi:aspartate racemase